MIYQYDSCNIYFHKCEYGIIVFLLHRSVFSIFVFFSLGEIYLIVNYYLTDGW